MKKFAFALLFVAGSAFANCDDITLPSHLSFGEHEECDSEMGLFVVSDDNTEQYGFVNQSGKLIIKTQFDEAWSFQEGLALVEKNDKWGYIKTDGSYAIKPTYDDGWGFSEGLAKVQKGEYVGFINPKNQVIIPIKYTNSNNWYNEGMVAVEQNNKWAIIDNKGTAITKFEYDRASSPSEGRILVGKDNKDGDTKYGFLDTKGKVVIPLIYDFATDFEDGTALVIKDDESFTINKQGKKTDD